MSFRCNVEIDSLIRWNWLSPNIVILLGISKFVS